MQVVPGRLRHRKGLAWTRSLKISDQLGQPRPIATCRAYVIGHRHESICRRNSTSSLSNSRTWNWDCLVKRTLDASGADVNASVADCCVDCESYFALMRNERAITSLLVRGSGWSWLILIFRSSFLWRTERKCNKHHCGEPVVRPGFEQRYCRVRSSSAVCYNTRLV